MTRALLSIGSNKSNPQRQIETARAALSQRFENVKMSSLYLTEPVGGVIQDDFINAAISLETNLNAHNFLKHLMELEEKALRNRETGMANGPRSLDLDIILFGDTSLTEANLTIPHPRFKDRRFVLEPMNELAPDAVDPASGKKISTLLDECMDNCWVKRMEEEVFAL